MHNRLAANRKQDVIANTTILVWNATRVHHLVNADKIRSDIAICVTVKNQQPPQPHGLSVDTEQFMEAQEMQIP